MAEITLDQVPKKVRDYYVAGEAAFQKGNLDYAVDMMSACVELEPKLARARRILREAEVRRLQGATRSALGHLVATLIELPTYLRTLTLLRSVKASQALALAEKLMRRDALNPKFVKVFMRAALAAEMPEAAIHALELAREASPHDAPTLHALGDLYAQNNNFKKAREAFEALCAIAPRDFAAQKKLKDATAMASIKTDGWQSAAEQGSYRDVMKDSGEAVMLEKESKAVKSEKDTEALIQEMRARIEREPKNVNYYRELSRLYAANRQFAEAAQVLERALAVSSGDPELTGALSTLKLRSLEHEIALRRAGGDEAAADELEAEKERFRFDDLRERVRRYPTDLRLRFEYGAVLLERGELNEAIQQFQMSQRSPKVRIPSLLRLALCLKQKRQYDLAFEQLNLANSELPIMDAMKKDVLYELGQTAESMDRRDQAAQFFKQIYQVDIGYKDVAAKVEGAYGASH
jgi:tetratricopeptide (TPR) repeat protein